MLLSSLSLTGTLAGLVILLGLVVLLIHRWQKSSETSVEKMPGPIGLPIIGASYIIGRYIKPWDAFSDLRKRYGDIYGVKLGSRDCVVVSSLAAIREVLVTKSDDFANRPDFLRFHAIFRGDRNFSIALCDWSTKQKARRATAFPFMHPRSSDLGCQRMSHYITSELRFLLQKLSEVQSRVVEPRNFLLLTTANIFYQFLCSKRFSVDDQHFLNVVETYDIVFRELFQGFAIDFMPWLRLLNRTKLRRLQKLADSVGEITAAIFSEHELQGKNEGFDRPRDLVDIFLDQSTGPDATLTREEAEVIIDDLIGGHSVLSNLWLWGLHFLAAHPHVAGKVRDETLSVTSGCRQTTLEDRPFMPYTEATVLELLRVISSPIIPHVATRDTSIQGYSVPKDHMVMFNTYDINMDPNNWDEPELFKPERFLNTENKVWKPDYFFPFSMGKRTCLGDGLVKSVLFLGFSTILQQYEIIFPPGVTSPDTRTIAGMVVPTEEIRLIFRHMPANFDTSLHST